jgi:proteic killer suppression protein
MNIRKVNHKGLRRFVEFDDAAGLPAEHIEKIRNIVSFLQEMSDP